MTDYQITEAILEEPESGVWVMDFSSILEPFSGTLEVYGESFTGVLASKVQDGETWRARLVGGQGKLGFSLPHRQYRGSTGSAKIVQDVIRLSGETAGVVSSTQIISDYERGNRPASASLYTIGQLVGCIWYVGRDGRVGFGASRAGARTVDLRDVPLLVEYEDGAELLSPESFGVLRPGDRSAGRRASKIRWVLSSNGLTATVSWVPSEATAAPSRASEDVDGSWYAQTFRGAVERHVGDTVDVIVDGKFSLASVPLLTPAKTRLSPGDLVTIGWFRNDPRLPYALSVAGLDIYCGRIYYTPGTPGMLQYQAPGAPAPVTVDPSGVNIIGIIQTPPV